MARLEPFRGTTYDPARVSAEEVVAPPYDVVGPAERARLAARSPYNAIHVELPEDPGGGDRYERAGWLFSSWRDEGILRRSSEPSFYLYRMTFETDDGTRRTTTGLFGALGLDPEQRGEVLPHEETTPKDKSDRLFLLRAARTNFSPIWGLSLSEGLGRLCEQAALRSGEPFAAHDAAGCLHECFEVSDAGFVEAARELVAASPVLLADGHHRYETACSFAAEDETEGSRFVLALVIELSEEQLHVEAIHRLISGIEPDELRSQLEKSFELRPAPGTVARLRPAMAEQGGLGLIAGGTGSLLVPRQPAREVDSVLLRAALAGLAGVEVTYQHDLAALEKALAGARAGAAVLLRPVSVAQIAATAHGGRRLPPKSTFFYPKILTGMVFRELDAG